MQRLLLLFLLGATVLETGCGSTSSGTNNSNSSTPSSGAVAVSLSPATASVRTGATQAFTAQVNNSSNQSVIWQVDGVSAGNSADGTVSAAGIYTAPATLPNPNTVTISSADTTASATSSVTLSNPTPTINSVTPSNLSIGPISLGVTGSGFVTGTQVLFAGVAMSTTFISSTTITATGTASANGTFGVSVSNPAPGASTSGAVNIQVGSGQGSGTPLACSAVGTGQGASLTGFVPFTSANLWNQDISGASVDPNSASIVNFIGGSSAVHADFGAGLYQGQSMGIPYIVAGSQQPFVGVIFTAYGTESDPGPMPIPMNAPIEGYPAPGNGDRHVLVLDNNNCWLYELYGASGNSDGSWNAASAAVWDMLSDEQRP